RQINRGTVRDDPAVIESAKAPAVAWNDASGRFEVVAHCEDGARLVNIGGRVGPEPRSQRQYLRGAGGLVFGHDRAGDRPAVDQRMGRFDGRHARLRQDVVLPAAPGDRETVALDEAVTEVEARATGDGALGAVKVRKDRRAAAIGDIEQ